MANIATPSGAKLTGHELVDLVSQRIDQQFQKEGSVTDLVSLAVFEVFSQHENLLVVRFTKEKIKEQACDWVEERLRYSSNHSNITKERVEKIQTKVSKIFDDVFDEFQKPNLNAKGIQKLLEIFHTFTGQKLDHGYFKKDNGHNEFEDFYSDIEVTVPLEDMEKQLHDKGYFQLRPIEKSAKKLIIGCGNGRLSCCGSRPNYMGFHKQLQFYCPSTQQDDKSIEYHRKYSIAHNHNSKEYVTIDPELASNATIVARFGETPIAELFNGQKFDEIIFEGYWPKNPGPSMQSDILDLLNEGGKVILDVGHIIDKTYLFVEPLQPRDRRPCLCALL